MKKKDLDVLSEISKFNNTIKKEKEQKKQVKKVKKPQKKIRRTKGNERIPRDQILNIEIFPEDDELTKLIKAQINNSSINMEYIYSRTNSSKGYNLYYGISTRNSMTWKTFCDWCEVLDLTYEINLTKN